jgi:hypothetical protein
VVGVGPVLRFTARGGEIKVRGVVWQRLARISSACDRRIVMSRGATFQNRADIRPVVRNDIYFRLSVVPEFGFGLSNHEQSGIRGGAEIFFAVRQLEIRIFPASRQRRGASGCRKRRK